MTPTVEASQASQATRQSARESVTDRKSDRYTHDENNTINKKIVLKSYQLVVDSSLSRGATDVDNVLASVSPAALSALLWTVALLKLFRKLKTAKL